MRNVPSAAWKTWIRSFSASSTYTCPLRSVAIPPTTPSRPGSRRLAREPNANRNVPSGSKAWTSPLNWSPTKTVPPPGVNPTACGKRKTPPPFGGSPTTDAVSGGGAAPAAAGMATSIVAVISASAVPRSAIPIGRV